MDYCKLLKEAESAYHRLMTGGAVAEFRDSNGELVRYTAQSAPRLKIYIQELKTKCSGSIGGGLDAIRPFGGVF